MTRVHDWKADPRGDAVLARPRTGRLEMTDAAQVAMALATGDPANGFTPNFDSGSGPSPGRDPDGYDAAHAFLDRHATGPWAWTETFVNCGRSAMICVYVERAPDAAVFAAAFPELFRHRPHGTFDVARIAALRGAMAPRGPLDSTVVWSAVNQGYRLKEGTDFLEIVFDDPWSERRFLAHPHAAMTIEETRDGERVHLSRIGDRGIWSHLSDCEAVGSFRTDDGLWILPVPGPEARSRFACHWAMRGFRWDAERGAFTIGDLPEIPERVVPRDFLDYLAGRREDFATVAGPGTGTCP